MGSAFTDPYGKIRSTCMICHNVTGYMLRPPQIHCLPRPPNIYWTNWPLQLTAEEYRKSQKKSAEAWANVAHGVDNEEKQKHKRGQQSTSTVTTDTPSTSNKHSKKKQKRTRDDHT